MLGRDGGGGPSGAPGRLRSLRGARECGHAGERSGEALPIAARDGLIPAAIPLGRKGRVVGRVGIGRPEPCRPRPTPGARPLPDDPVPYLPTMFARPGGSRPLTPSVR